MCNTKLRVPLFVLTLAVVAIGSALAPSAQSKPNFSGTWTMDETKSVSPHYPGFVGPVTVVITQTATTMTIETHRGDKQDVLEYRIVQNEGTAPEATASDAAGPPFKAYMERPQPGVRSGTRCPLDCAEQRGADVGRGWTDDDGRNHDDCRPRIYGGKGANVRNRQRRVQKSVIGPPRRARPHAASRAYAPQTVIGTAKAAACSPGTISATSDCTVTARPDLSRMVATSTA